MPRPKRKRKVFSLPIVEGYKPFGSTLSETEAVILLFEEYEALKLADYQNLTQEEAAKKMNISRPTFTRIYEKARKTIATAFVEGKIIIIRGGDVHLDHKKEKHHKYEGEIDGENCICPKCEVRIPHIRNHPCREQMCPECGQPMFRENVYQMLSKIRKE